MKKVIVNRIKIKTSQGRFEKGETVVLSDEDFARVTALRPDTVILIEDIADAPKKARAKRKKPNAKPEAQPIDGDF